VHDVADELAFIGLAPDPNEGVQRSSIAIVDITDPAAMELVELVEGFEGIGGLEVANGHLFMTDTPRGLFVYEIVRA
jgi:hypothetical protein